ADAINNANISGVSAFVNDDNELQILSSVGDVTIAESVANGNNTLGIDGATAVDTGSLAGVSIATVAGSNFAIARVDTVLTTVNELRGTLGAIQNRFESTIVNLQTVSENLAASRGRIEGADVAAETARQATAAELQAAGVAMVAHERA